MVIKVLALVSACNTAQEGAVIAAAVRNRFQKKRPAQLSFEGVFDVPSSFVNAAIVALITEFGADRVKSNLSIRDVTPQIANMIRRCVDNAISGLAA